MQECRIHSMEATTRGSARARAGFTLIELLVVVAIIAVLISILLPALGASRKSARAVKCAAHLRQVSQAMAGYLAESRSVYPPSYIYALDRSGNYDLQRQPQAPVDGYIHWSWFLYNRGQAGDEAFTCPEIRSRGGVPRTNPGPMAEHWEGDQRDVENNHKPPPANAIEDKQAPRCAFTGNAAIFPRNKFTTELSGGARINRLVNESEIRNPGDVILATEFNRNWRVSAEGNPDDAYVLGKGHRPVNPFMSLSSGSDEYAAPLLTETFSYLGSDGSNAYGLLPQNVVDNMTNAIGQIGIAETNAVGRHHPGGDKLGGTANFVFVDGHVERQTILQSLKDRQWGDKYYALTGNTTVLDRYGQISP